MANCVDPDETPHSAASHLGLHCLLRSVCPNIYGNFSETKNSPFINIRDYHTLGSICSFRNFLETRKNSPFINMINIGNYHTLESICSNFKTCMKSSAGVRIFKGKYVGMSESVKRIV